MFQLGPFPIVLNLRTMLALIVPVITAVIGATGVMLNQFHETKSHIKNKSIHVEAESKAEAKQARTEMIKAITGRQDVKIREVKVDQREQIEKLGETLRGEQRAILREIRRNRRAMGHR